MTPSPHYFNSHIQLFVTKSHIQVIEKKTELHSQFGSFIGFKKLVKNRQKFFDTQFYFYTAQILSWRLFPFAEWLPLIAVVGGGHNSQPFVIYGL